MSQGSTAQVGAPRLRTCGSSGGSSLAKCLFLSNQEVLHTLSKELTLASKDAKVTDNSRAQPHGIRSYYHSDPIYHLIPLPEE